MQHYKNFIDGKWVDSESKETIKVDDPATRIRGKRTKRNIASLLRMI